ncbi:Sec-independent protein translocase subunit TatB [Vandammella animalimorsus]|uniref:Sec-independent protein translocase protein TatB n=1 Tax=Vandammella animalimorsus TaxID=2029117 RepID=A0A3M6RVA0_9BURK|nr:Sec-independent protein translocase protein TatB [Vandammella animalimorsus]RMX18824.1 Sec-independent protein translocase subunit TatB [Vandammella animalimorsus]
MFDLGISKMVMIGVVALIVIGPERLPRVARTVGALLGKAQRYVNEVKREVNQAMELDELRKVKTSVEEAARDLEHSVRTHASDFQKEVETLSKDLQDVPSWEEGSMQQDEAASAAPEDGLEDASKRAFVTAVAPVSAPAARKNWRARRQAVPQWYKARQQVRRSLRSSAARRHAGAAGQPSGGKSFHSAHRP